MKITKKEILIGTSIIGSIGSIAAGIYSLLNKETKEPVVAKPSEVISVNKSLYDEDGYDVNGFDKNGYDRDGYNQSGYDKNGFDLLGYNSEGFNSRGYDSEGYNKKGYNSLGFNRLGYNQRGYDKSGYNILGLDVCGKSRKSYDDVISILENKKEVAFKSLKEEQLDIAQLKARTIMEDAITFIIKHYYGESSSYVSKKLQRKIDLLKKLNIYIDDEFISRCHGVRKICNPAMHSVLDPTIPHEKAHFAVIQAKESLQLLKKIIGGMDNE